MQDGFISRDSISKPIHYRPTYASYRLYTTLTSKINPNIPPGRLDGNLYFKHI